MSAQNGVLIACEALQDNLANYFNTCSEFSEPMPLYEMMLSEVNSGGFQQVLSPGDGKVRTGRMIYEPRELHTNATTNGTYPLCEATDTAGNRWQDYTIDTSKNRQVNELITLSDLEDICEDTNSYITRRIAKKLDQLDRAMGYKLSEEAVLLAGAWGSDVQNVDGDGNLNVATLRTGTTDQLSPQTMQKIRTAAMQSGYCDAYFIAGGIDMYEYADAIKLGCCTDYGMDLAATFARFGTAVAYDRPVEQAMGGSEFSLVVQNGALQVVTWNGFAGSPWRMIGDGAYRQSVIYTRRGLPVDFMLKFDCGAWHIVMTAVAEVKAMPLDMFFPGDPFAGVNFVNTLEVVNS